MTDLPQLNEINPLEEDALDQYKALLPQWATEKRRTFDALVELLPFNDMKPVYELLDSQKALSRLEGAIYLLSNGIKPDADLTLNRDNSMAEEIKTLRKKVEKQDKEIKKLTKVTYRIPTIRELEIQVRMLREKLRVMTVERDSAQREVDDIKIVKELDHAKS